MPPLRAAELEPAPPAPQFEENTSENIQDELSEDAPPEDALESEEPEHLIIDVPQIKSRERIDTFLARQVVNATRNKVQTAIDEGRVTLNGKPVKANTKLRPADRIELIMTHPPAPEMLPENLPLEIIYEDREMLVINKAAGMVVHPAYGNWTGTLANAVLYHTQNNLSRANGDLRPGIVHRLDKDTSGIIVVAKNDAAHHALAKQFAARTTEKTYTALVWGVPVPKEGVIKTNIGRSNRDRKVMAVFAFGSAHGKEAITDYEVEEDFKFFSLLSLQLHTGRTHQIRVHLQQLKHSIVGDETYGGKTVRKLDMAQSDAFVQNLFTLMPRQALHARRLTLAHPVTEKRITFEAPLPADMNAALEKIRSLKK
ncbi:MAG: RluA family pseudouridine synthase [Rhizobacter sp.]|nr:RluA family pseudouridine synthase [Chlorobiales bacterium]